MIPRPPVRSPSSSSLRSLALASAIAAALAGCDDKPKTETAAAIDAAPAAPVATATPSAEPTAAPPPKKKPLAEALKCDALLPEEKRVAAGLLNYKLTQQNVCADCGPTCSLVRPDKPFEGVAVAYVCNEPFDKAAADKTTVELKKTLGKPVTLTLGRGGVMGEKDSGLYYAASVVDDDSDCRINIDWMRGEKKTVEGLVKIAVAGIKQADVTAAKSEP